MSEADPRIERYKEGWWYEGSKPIEKGFYRLESLAQLDDRNVFPQSLRAIVWQIWCLDKNTWCILTDHDFTEAEAKETLEALQGGAL